PFQPEHLAILCPTRNLETKRLAAERLDLGFPAKDRGRQRNRDARVKILALHVEFRMRHQSDPKIEIARLRSRRSVLTLTGNAHTRSVADAGWNSDVDVARTPIVGDRESPGCAVQGVLEVQLDLLLDIAPLTRCARARAASASSGLLIAADAAAEE